MPLVVMDMDTSISTGSPRVGQPAAIGLGVIAPLRAPCGATEWFSGAEVMSRITSPSSVTRFR